MSSVYSLATQDLHDYAGSAAETNGIPTDYFLRFINAESGWNPAALSPKGALGLTQIIPAYHPGVDPLNPYESIDYSARTIRGYYEQFGSWESAFAAWNAGPGAVKKYSGVPPYQETQNFVRKIIGSGPVGTPTPATSSSGPAELSGTAKVLLYAAGLVLLILAFRNLKGR